MNIVTKLADLNPEEDVLEELLERIEQMETQEGPGYGPCLAFYKRLADRLLPLE